MGPHGKSQDYLNIAQTAIELPPPHSAGQWALFSGRFEQIRKITVLTVHKFHKASWQALTQANAYLNFNFYCMSSPNQPGNGFSEPPPQKKQKKQKTIKSPNLWGG